MHTDPLLIKKYDQPVPRYTSYPTVPFWENEISTDQWKTAFASEFDRSNHTEGLSLYIHLPFCESLCTYCGCNKKITSNHSVEEVYIETVLKEWRLYRKLMAQTPVIRQLHLGGGTPTFFSPDNLKRFLTTLLKDCIIHPLHEFSIEGHPNNTTLAHLQCLSALGFRRISYGVQDLDIEVQRVINRIQPFANVVRATEDARQEGFNSINFDLIYGLPKQSLESIESTINQVITLKPDRIAFYSYAHVPWTSRGQRLFDENDLPSPENKLQLYLRGKELLSAAGYADIGMDHFALKHDSLYEAFEEKSLYRNFMGYSSRNPGLLLGLGVSSISDIGSAYSQNAKTLGDYYRSINSASLACQRGYFLSDEDIYIKKCILDISCTGALVLKEEHLATLKEKTFPLLRNLEQDGLIDFDGINLKVREAGHPFLRNICSAFDLKLQAKVPGEVFPKFSQAI